MWLILSALGLLGLSNFGPGLSTPWTRDAFLAKLPAERSLEVPYYTQADTEWCAATSATMLLRAYGKDVEVWTVARKLNLEARTGLSPMRSHVMGELRQVFRDQGLEVDDHILPWQSRWALAHRITTSLSEGRPVWIGFLAQNHAVLAVGFNRSGLYIHDPSGAITRDMLGSTQRVNVFITWDDFERCCTGGLPNWVFVLSVKTPMPRTSPVTVMLDKDLAFEHPAMPWNRNQRSSVVLTWDGTVDPGYRFAAAANRGEVLPHHATNDSRIHARKVFLANGSAAAQTVVVTATLGGELLYRDTLTLDPHAEGTFVLNPPTTGTDNGLPMPKRFTPGAYDLVVEARQNADVLDKVCVKVGIGPSQVKRVRREFNDLVWDNVPEDGIVYDIYLAWPIEGVGVKQATVRKARGELTHWSIPAELLGLRESRWLYVVARHARANLTGSPSEFKHLPQKASLAVGTWKGDFPAAQPPRPLYLSGFKRMIIHRQSNGVWMLGGHEQFLFYSNDPKVSFIVRGDRVEVEWNNHFGTGDQRRHERYRFVAEVRGGNQLVGHHTLEIQGQLLWRQEFTLTRVDDASHFDR